MGELVVTTLITCFCIVAGGLAGWALIVGGRKSARSWNAYCETHPPISDDEYLRLCDPGVSRDVALKVRAIICDCTGIDYERIYPDTRLMQDIW